jgi:hypothetical protein
MVMSERIYLFLIGLTILIALYFEIEKAIYALCLFLIFEAITNLRLTTISQKLLKHNVDAGLAQFKTKMRFDIDAFLVWRMLVAVMLGGSFILLNQYNAEIIWFIPWFMGFAILGAGLSGVCPAVLFIRWIGFR